MTRQVHIMGVLNTTPDSFSDGGQYLCMDSAVNRAAEMVAEGADYIDVGGESTRPGAAPVSISEELERVIPVVEAIAGRFAVGISVDTQKAEVAKQALISGATMVNDVSAVSDPAMAQVVKRADVPVIIMHMQGTPKTMQSQPTYPNGVVEEVISFFEDKIRSLIEFGLRKDRLILDPGIGFGKTLEHNLQLIAGLNRLSIFGVPLAIGTSRKSFIAKLLGDPKLPMALREEGTLVSNLVAYQAGVSYFRVHNPGALSRALKTWEGIAHVRQ